MTTCLVDTSVLIDLSKGVLHVREHLRTSAAGGLRLSAASAGWSLATTDMLIAALALSRDAAVLTDDTRYHDAVCVEVRSVRSAR